VSLSTLILIILLGFNNSVEVGVCPLKRNNYAGVLRHPYNSSTWQARQRNLNSRPVWLPSVTLPQKKKNTKDKKRRK
jgi:hypothetical protein